MSSPPILFAAVAASLLAAPASAQRPADQNSAFRDAQRGRIMPLRRIEERAREHPATRGSTYLGPELDAGATTYRLKFLRGNRVMWIDIDARSGRVLQTSGEPPAANGRGAAGDAGRDAGRDD